MLGDDGLHPPLQATGPAGASRVSGASTSKLDAPVGICRISNKDVLISPLKKNVNPYVIHVLSLFKCCGWKQIILIMYVYVECFVQCYAAYYVIMVLILWY